MNRIFLLALVALSGCQTASPQYRPATGSGGSGYSEVVAPNGQVTIIYTGDRGMSPRQVSEYAMLRAAELTLASGKQWFAIIQAATRPASALDINSIDGRSGAFLTTQSTTAGGGGDKSNSPPGVSDGVVPGGPSIGGFGGGDVPYQVIERWTPKTVHRTAMVIQMGSGSKAAFDGLETAPEIYAAQAIADEIRGKISR